MQYKKVRQSAITASCIIYAIDLKESILNGGKDFCQNELQDVFIFQQQKPFQMIDIKSLNEKLLLVLNI